MFVYKKLKSSDANKNPFEAHKHYTVVNETTGSLGISFFNTSFTSASIHLFENENDLLNPLALDLPDADNGIALGTTRNPNTTDKNHEKLLDAIDGGGSFIVDSEENISSQFYFVRAKNKEFNYSSNPSFIDTNGNLNFDSIVDNPRTFITTIGLYNDSNELLAVAKLSQPVAKDFTKEALIKVKLDY